MAAVGCGPDEVFAALADPTRREILRRLSLGGPQSSGRLLAQIGMTRQGASRHLATLEDCGLVVSKRQGRTVTRELNLEPLRGTQDWMNQLATAWDARLARLKASYEV